MRKSIKKEELIAVLQRMENEDLYNFFLRCCEVENLDLCQICLDAGFNVNSRESTYGTPVIVMLVSTEKLTIKVADWLIKKGADINLKSIKHWKSRENYKTDQKITFSKKQKIKNMLVYYRLNHLLALIYKIKN